MFYKAGNFFIYYSYR